MMILLRWAFFPIARLVDFLSILIHVIYFPYFRLKLLGTLAKDFKPKPWITPKELIELGSIDALRNEIYSSEMDSHNLMVQVGHGFFHPEWAGKMAEGAVTAEGSLHRFCPGGYGLPPSRDMLAAWCYFYVVNRVKRPDLLRRVARHYLKNCFTLNNQDGTPSSRSNPGFNILHGDSWGGISAPVSGPHYLSGAALLSLAAHDLGGVYRLVYPIYKLLFMGWFFELIPYMHFKNKLWFYEAHVAQMSLYVLSKTRGGYRFAMRWISQRIVPGNQPFFAGMAAECGHLSSEERGHALSHLCSIKLVWPQHVPKVEHQNVEGKDINYSMMALAAVQLKDGKI